MSIFSLFFCSALSFHDCVCVCVCACACACVRVSGGGLQDNSIRPGSTRGLHAAETALTPEVLTAHHKNAGCLSLASDV